MRTSRIRLVAITGLAVVAMAAAACASGTAGGTSSTPAGGSGTTTTSGSGGAGGSASSGASASSGGGSASAGGSGSTGVASSGSGGSSAAPSGSGSSTSAPSGSGGTVEPAKATSAADFGGMDGLVAAAKKEGAINVIALPPDWANYGEIIKAFSDTYGITVNSQNPNGSSAQEIQAAVTNKGTDKAPDVFDLGSAVALASTQYFAPYKVQSFADIPDVNKDPNGLWVNDYTGVMSVGYNSTKYGTISSLDDLKNAKFKGAVALNGNPTQAGAAFSGVVMAALANGGSADNIGPGVDFFASLKQAGTFLPIDPTPATIGSGQTGAVIDWSYNQLAAATALKKQGVDWKMFVPPNAAVGSYYVQAINVDGPHPAAARLWEEFLYSAKAQNMWIKGGALPVLYDSMKKSGTLDAAVQSNLPQISGTLVQLTAAQQKTASEYLQKNWSKVSG